MRNVEPDHVRADAGRPARRFPLRPPRTSLYRLLQASWGIWINVTAQVSLGKAVTGEQVDPPRPVRIAFEGPAADLPRPYRRQLSSGLAAAAAAISERFADQPVTVTVLEVAYPECDFQVEGLSVAMCRWAEEEFGLPPRRIDASYDRDSDRYVFHWR